MGCYPYEVQLNFSPQAKAQLVAKATLLTHNAGLHEVDLGWHPKAVGLLYRGDQSAPPLGVEGVSGGALHGTVAAGTALLHDPLCLLTSCKRTRDVPSTAIPFRC
ncbi:hypothetical protein [Deinococcus sp. QL22]|uniref:hypothetical protein n=1 Tax=Deinococcus sp. QL22 TaxID=2939437 RepID=UPI00353023DF